MPVAENALCTYDDILIFKDNHQSVSDNDELIEELINRKTEEFHKYLRIPQLLERSYTEYHDGDGTRNLYPYRTPVISLSALNDDTNWDYDTSTEIDTTNCMIINNQYIFRKDNEFTQGQHNIKIVYTAGFETIPEDIRLACIKEVTRDFNRRYDFDITALTQEDGSLTYVEKGLLKSTRDVLDRYKQYTVGIF